jgi:glyoxylase-like metal-dependent hydrolase (beta-lactamase superfamily II)
MKRKDFLLKAGFASAALLLGNLESIAQHFAKAGYSIKMINESFGIFTEKGGTILFYFGKNGVSIVDSQFPDTISNLLKDLATKGKTKFEYLINTHHHGDHTGGNLALSGKVKDVIAHANSAINQKANAIKQKSEEKQLYPTLTYTESLKKKIGKERLEMHYYGAAHTNGDSVVYFKKAKIAHLGDLVFNRRFPFIDKSAGANIANWIRVLQNIQDNFDDATIFIAGHAEEGYDVILQKKDIKAFQNYLSELLKLVASEIAAGKTKEEIMKLAAIPNAPEWKGKGIERSLAAAFEELTTK